MAKPTRLTLRSIIDAAGGTNRVARECGLTSGAVSQWLQSGRLPMTEINGHTRYAEKLIALAGLECDVWDVRLIGRR